MDSQHIPFSDQGQSKYQKNLNFLWFIIYFLKSSHNTVQG